MRAAFGYGLTVVLTAAFGLFFDAQFGFTFLAVLLAAPALSAGMTMAARRGVRVKTSCSQDLVKKGDTVELVVEVENRGFLPVPLAEIKLCCSAHFQAQGEAEFRATLAPKKTLRLTGLFTAAVRGAGTMELSGVTVRDFMGLVRFDLRQREAAAEWTQTAAVLPDVPEAPENTALLQRMLDAAAFEENEETTDSPTAMNGFPGYEHRPYTPGDPLKKINWKLSAKRGNLLVRLDEQYAGTRQNILLDLRTGQEQDALLRQECAAEGVLAILALCVRRGAECNLFYFDRNAWQSHVVIANSDVEWVRGEFARLAFFTESELAEKRIPYDKMGGAKIGSLMIFSAKPDKALEAQRSEFMRLKDVSAIIAPNAPEHRGRGWWLAEKTGAFIRFTND
ncbi:MAG: DUF58 domain-containing protein [Oscillospiraceae bacterium]